MTTTQQSLARFVTLARRGASPGSSSGEKTANRLAATLHQIGDDMAVLDDSLFDGFILLCRAAHGPWPTDTAKESAFNHIAQAAGANATP